MRVFVFLWLAAIVATSCGVEVNHKRSAKDLQIAEEAFSADQDTIQRIEIEASGSSSGDDDTAAKTKEAPAAQDDQEPADQDEELEATEQEDVPEDDVLIQFSGACLQAFATEPSSAANDNFEMIEVDVGNGNNQVFFADDSEDEQDEDAPVDYGFVIDVKADSLNNGSAKLTKPNAWYCLVIEADSANNIQIEAACRDRVALVSENGTQLRNTILSGENCGLSEMD